MHIAQLIAAYAVAEVLDGRNLTVALPKASARFHAATSQQQAAAQDFSYLTLRFYAESAASLKILVQKPVTDRRVNALLLVAITQLLHSDAEVFTVVNQAVEAAAKLRLSWAKGLVNGILRNFLRQQNAIVSSFSIREDLRFNYPQWWIDLLKAQYPEYWQSILAVGNQHPPMTLRVNTRKIDVFGYITLLKEAGMSAMTLGAAAIQLEKPVSVHKLPEFQNGWVSVQDAAAQCAAPLLDLQPGMRVLDACSAPGGKTGHILEICDVDLWALDIEEARLLRVHENIDRLGYHATVQLGDAGQNTWFDGQLFDRILADVPCSASGIVRRHVDMKWLRRPQDVLAFAKQQSEILVNLWKMLAKDGKLLYVTCSVFQQENEMLIQQFLNQHADAQRLPVLFDLVGLQNLRLSSPGQLLPSMEHDGLFYALLQKH